MNIVIESMASPGSQSSRRRGAGFKETATEDQALNMIAREAEARLSAKRASRAEARSIRMKEIERKQKEAEEEGMTSENNDTFDDVSVRRGTQIISPLLPSYDSADSIISTVNVTNETQILQLKEAVREGEFRYNRAMVNAAQLDNEKQALQYQVEALKDIIEELQEKVDNSTGELADQSRDFNKLNREQTTTTSELNKCLYLLEERDRVLDENGINEDGTFKTGYTLVKCSPCNDISNDVIEKTSHNSEKGSLLAEIAILRNEISDLKNASSIEQSRREFESLKRNMQNQILELGTQIQLLEQSSSQKEGMIVRLESQIKRYKHQTDTAESVEDGLLAEKRKLLRDLRQAQERIVELETEKEQLDKRFEKLKNRRGIEV